MERPPLPLRPRAATAPLALVFLLACGGAPPPTETGASDGPAVSIPNAREPLPGVITGGPPTDADLEAARDAGVRTVVSLQTDAEPGAAEEQARVEARGMRFVSIPVAGPDGLTDEAAAELDAVLDDPEARPLILHCASGNRAGALLGLRQARHEGASVEQALSVARDAGMSSAAMEEALRSRLSAEGVDSTP